MRQTDTVALLGAGLMGTGMGRSLLRAGLKVRAWNRTRERLRPLEEAGARACESAREAARGAGVVLTMLSDGAAVEAVMTGADGVLASLDPGAVWAQMSTVGIAATERLMAAAAGREVAYVDAPVLGTREPAEAGQLLVLASGEEAALRACERVFSAVGSRTLPLGAAGQGTRTKLVVNAWLVGLLGALAESFAVARSVGVPEERLLEVIAGGGLDVKYAHLKGKLMLAHSYPASFPLQLALKDARLVREAAAAAKVSLPVMEGVIRHFERALEKGLGGEDMAALAEAVGR
ncbi:NAD(P)-dependent oxidoreductase [Aggregicoccus sp. 17bor-14]|uniref:NAD(P)-dependent oxidoreductase n=1 Tax=Myxococcaceae TaxID=31 RepID=UPI00129C11D3|nr:MULTISPECIES: NAD(P)-dependent oxidoreductase [Myxococcaceae]MBF5046560.1 NAD(P)-dependent oxidoreductase [Simulacricoccus sp. 17bor-14]MRI92271.1 NAD(P)-dependent oxidoreductase [Aggregicoccus sp. 17bor-14]